MLTTHAVGVLNSFLTCDLNIVHRKYVRYARLTSAGGEFIGHATGGNSAVLSRGYFLHGQWDFTVAL